MLLGFNFKRRLRLRPLRKYLRLRRNFPSALQFKLIVSVIVGFLLSEVFIIPQGLQQPAYTVTSFSESPPRLKFGRWNDLEMEIAKNLTKSSDPENPDPPSPIVYVITPTFKRERNIQQAELIRVAQSLYLTKHFVHWMIMLDEETNNRTDLRKIKHYLSPYQLSLSVHLSFHRPAGVSKAKGVSGRLKALRLLHKKRKTHPSGIVYFADDDNTYDYELFEQIKQTTKISMWPVGCLTPLGVGTPLLNRNGKVVKVFDGWVGGRKFPVDFAGFAVYLEFDRIGNGTSIPYSPGRLEDSFLKWLNISLEDVQPLANNCTRILTWHTRQSRYIDSY